MNKTVNDHRIRILFLCTGNSCRSQMAEGFARDLIGESVIPYSAGLTAKGLDPYALKVMAEVGIDVSQQSSKTVASLEGVDFDYCITVCGHADEHCPVFPGSTTVIHHGFDDPPHLAADAHSEEERLAHYRRVRDEIREFITTLPERLGLRR